MIEPILIRSVGGEQYQWLDIGQADVQPSSGNLQELATLATPRNLLLVWPAASALLLEIELPVRNTAQIAKALPFALEDHLADDLERYHWVWQRQSRQGTVGVAAVAHDAIAQCRADFAAAGLRLLAVCPEPLFLAEEPGGAVIADSHCVFRTGFCQGGGGECDVVRPWLSAAYPDLECQPLAQPLPLYASRWRDALVWNLLTGAHAPPSRSMPSFRELLPAAALVLLGAAIQLGGQWYQSATQSRQIEQYEQRNQALFRATFPDVKRLVNLKAQADQQLAALTSQAAVEQAGFLALLHRAGSTLTQQPSLALQGLAFGDDGMTLKLSVASAASVDAWVASLRQAGDLTVETRTQTSQQHGVEVHIGIRQN
ncbi:MAG: hypothetical protein KGZ80_07215 [Methylomonas sp.]|nr:hypothetical protein [Methylomonas sp.]